MNLTSRQAIDKLDAAKAFPSGMDDSDKFAMLNEALEAITLDERYVGSEAMISVQVDQSGILTLPRQFMTIKAAKVGGYVRDMSAPWYEFISGTSDISQFDAIVQDQEDGWPTITDPPLWAGLPNAIPPVAPAATRLRTTVGGTPPSQYLEVHGHDINGAEIWNGTQRGYLIPYNGSFAGSAFLEIDEIIKPATDYQVFLYAENGANPDVLIGVFEPGETVPSYRRYMVPELMAQVASPTKVTCLVQRRHIDMVADNDILPLANFRGIKNAVLSIHFENEGDPTRAAEHLTVALDFFNKELIRSRPPTELGQILISASNCGAIGLRSFR